MSSSPSRAPLAASREQAPGPFPYDTLPDIAGRNVLAASGEICGAGTDALSRETQAHAQGVRAGLAQSEKAFEERLARERAGAAAALAQFTRDRASYFQKVEGEVVQLALSIARKILHREAQVDPLLLAGIVRVALEKIEGATGVRLRVHPQNAADWRRYLSLQLDPADLPQILEDPSQTPDSCVLETAMGTAELGLEVQLKEIEHGLMDLLAARPGASS